jgi:hypothetical protein
MVSAGAVYAVRVASILVAYKAKMLCSEVFVAGRDAHVAEKELEVDDLTPLKYISTAVDSEGRRVTSSVAGFIRHEAIYRENRGCAVQFGPGTAKESTAHLDHGRTADALVVPANESFAQFSIGRLPSLIPNVRGAPGLVVVCDGTSSPSAMGRASQWTRSPRLVDDQDRDECAGGHSRQGGSSRCRSPGADSRVAGRGRPRREITLDHLLHMSSGLRFNESPSNPVSDVTVMLLGSPEAGLYAARKPLAAAPGTTWQYSSGTTNIISRLVRRVINDDVRYLAFPRIALFDRIGMTHVVLEADAGGTFVGSSFMYATARDWARLGQLYVQDGVWAGQRILPKDG